NIPPPMLPYPHHFVTPDNIEVDFRLHNHDLQAKLQSIVSSLISTSIPKHCYFKRFSFESFHQKSPGSFGEHAQIP
ncbi:unnamed protein product, partial [Rotaria magnacalcarata]